MRKAIKPFVREFKNRSQKPVFSFRMSGPLLDNPKPSHLAVDAPIEAKPQQAIEARHILPSLIEVPDPLALRLQEAEKKSRAGRKAKPKEVVVAVATTPSAPPAEEQKPHTRVVPVPHREQSSIQMRWVLKINQPGESWKQRRLHRQLDR